MGGFHQADGDAPDSAEWTDYIINTVFQLETAVGAAISCFEGAMAIQVPRTRFVPVKTHADLLVIRSDAYKLSEGCLKLDTSAREVQDKSKPPIVKLDTAYKNNAEFKGLKTFSHAPSLINCESMEIIGPQVSFAKGVIIKGNVKFVNNRTNPVEDNKVEDNKAGSDNKTKPVEDNKVKEEEEPRFSNQEIPAGVYNGGKGKTYEAGGPPGKEKKFKPDDDPHWIVR